MQEATRNKILMVEDEEHIVALVQTHIEMLGLDFESTGDGEDGLEKALSGEYSLLILDVMLPRLDGVEICRRVREHDKAVPIMMLTARGDELDRVMGLELGADDYITKPFSVAELKSRIKALLRRSQVSATQKQNEVEDKSSHIRYRDLEIDLRARSVIAKGELAKLSAREYDLLLLFAKNPGKAYSRDNILNFVWDSDLEAYQTNVNTQINRLRKKIEPDPNNPIFIQTVWGFGYRFAQIEELAEAGQLVDDV